MCFYHVPPYEYVFEKTTLASDIVGSIFGSNTIHLDVSHGKTLYRKFGGVAWHCINIIVVII